MKPSQLAIALAITSTAPLFQPVPAQAAKPDRACSYTFQVSVPNRHYWESYTGYGATLQQAYKDGLRQCNRDLYNMVARCRPDPNLASCRPVAPASGIPASAEVPAHADSGAVN